MPKLEENILKIATSLITIRLANRHMKNAQHHSSTEKCQLKPQWDMASSLSEWLSPIYQQTSTGEDVEKRELVVGVQTGTATVESSMGFPQKIKNRTAL